MIRKAQLKFICIVMSILLGFFAIIFAASFVILKNVRDDGINRVLDDVVQNFDSQGEDFIQTKGLICVYKLDKNKQIISSQKWFDTTFFTEEEAEYIIHVAVEDRPYNAGSINDVYYKTFAYKDNYILVATDMEHELILFRESVLKAFLALMGIYLVITFIVWILSFSVFSPIRENLKKQKQFISDASHELKTPLAIISANADVLAQSEDNQWVNNIKEQTDRMGVLISNMLALERIDEKPLKLSFTEFNLSAEILSSVLPFEAVAFEKGKFLNVDIDDKINYKGSQESVKQIVSILMDNAVKYANKGGVITVTLKKEIGKNVALTVYNTGSQIPAEDSNKIFERFYRGDASRSRESGGSGLGLAIAKSIADANKWKITAESIPNESMTIKIIF